MLEKGEQLLEEAHPDAVPVLQNMIQALQDEWKELKKMASDRSEELATALLEVEGVEEMLAQLWEWVEGARKKLAAKQAEPIGDTLEVVEAQLAEHEVDHYVVLYCNECCVLIVISRRYGNSTAQHGGTTEGCSSQERWWWQPRHAT